MVRTYFLRLIYDIFCESNENSTIIINFEHLSESYIRYYGKEINEFTDTVI